MPFVDLPQPIQCIKTKGKVKVVIPAGTLPHPSIGMRWRKKRYVTYTDSIPVPDSIPDSDCNQAATSAQPAAESADSLSSTE